MQTATETEFAAMLQRFGEGDPKASEGLMSLLYSELHRLAEFYMSDQPGGHTLQATALVSEAYLRLLGSRDRTWNSRRHLMTAAAKAMRCVLVDHARKRADRTAMETDFRALDRVLVTYESRAVDLLALERALEELAQHSPRMAQAVELRFFAGLEMDEVADILEMPKRTLEREWELTRAWLYERVRAWLLERVA
jgi:RNA polymerase sigma factor (TIGR02999 family)